MPKAATSRRRPVRGKASSFDPTLVMSTDSSGGFINPPGYTCVAFYHSHPANYDKLKNLFKHWGTEDIHTSINAFLFEQTWCSTG